MRTLDTPVITSHMLDLQVCAIFFFKLHTKAHVCWSEENFCQTSLLPLFGILVLNSGHQAWWKGHNPQIHLTGTFNQLILLWKFLGFGVFHKGQKTHIFTTNTKIVSFKALHKYSSHPLWKKVIWQEMDTVTEIHNCSNAEDNWFWGTQPQIRHLAHNPYMLSSGNIVLEWCRKISRARGQEYLLWHTLFY